MTYLDFELHIEDAGAKIFLQCDDDGGGGVLQSCSSFDVIQFGKHHHHRQVFFVFFWMHLPLLMVLAKDELMLPEDVLVGGTLLDAVGLVGVP